METITTRSPPSKRIKLELSPSSDGIPEGTQKDAVEEDNNSDVEHCSICLQPIADRTVIPTCSHEFCFECLLVWTDQSRRCPLCAQTIGEYLIHHIRSKYDYQKHYLAPLRTSPQPLAVQQAVRRRAQDRREREWGRRQHRAWEEADELQRAIERRRWVYQHNLYAKHVATNSYTRYRPFPAPAQFSADPVLISRATAFIRRELHVWVGLDIEFLTTFTLSLMKSLDIRSEPAVRLLAEFLDMDQGGSRVNAEHFAHELYCYLRSPFRDIAVYDTVVQYDAPADVPTPSVPAYRRRWAQREHSRSRSAPRSPSSDRGRPRSLSRSRSSSSSPPSPLPTTRPNRPAPKRHRPSHDRRDTHLHTRPSASRQDSWRDASEDRRHNISRRQYRERSRDARPPRRRSRSREQSRDRERRWNSPREPSVERVPRGDGLRDIKEKGKACADEREYDAAEGRLDHDLDDADGWRLPEPGYQDAHIGSATSSGQATGLVSGTSSPRRSSCLLPTSPSTPKSTKSAVTSVSAALSPGEASRPSANQLPSDSVTKVETNKKSERRRPPARVRNRNLLESVQAHLADRGSQPRLRKQSGGNGDQETGDAAPHLLRVEDAFRSRNGHPVPRELTDPVAPSLLSRLSDPDHMSHPGAASASPVANAPAPAAFTGELLHATDRRLSAPEIMARTRARLARPKDVSALQDNSNGPANAKNDGGAIIDGNVMKHTHEPGGARASEASSPSVHIDDRVPRSTSSPPSSEHEATHYSSFSTSASLRSILLSRLAEEKRIQNAALAPLDAPQLDSDGSVVRKAVPMVFPSRSDDEDRSLDDIHQPEAAERAAQREAMLRSEAQLRVRLARAKRLATEQSVAADRSDSAQVDTPIVAPSREELLKAKLVRRKA